MAVSAVIQCLDSIRILIVRALDKLRQQADGVKAAHGAAYLSNAACDIKR